jgi:hypothetical protein
LAAAGGVLGYLNPASDKRPHETPLADDIARCERLISVNATYWDLTNLASTNAFGFF